MLLLFPDFLARFVSCSYPNFKIKDTKLKLFRFNRV